ncbi:MAG TPA: hypothetical protein VK337_06815 [Xanthobacteraceae bacterium]|nr:hypothetical protein [Xanthobacteraceae bacterium]
MSKPRLVRQKATQFVCPIEEARVSLLQDARSSTSARIGVVLFWTIVGAVLGSSSPKLLSFAETHDTLFTALGTVLGFGVGAFAAVGTSRLALILAFPAFLFWLLPF